jgi:hypothetical protein
MIELTFFNLLGVTILSTMIAYSFEPIQTGKRKFINLLLKKPNSLTKALSKLLSCGRCMSFWISLFLFSSIMAAAIAGLLGFLIQHLEDRINYWYER